MTTAIQQTGFFRSKTIKEGVFSKHRTSGLPQLVLSLSAEEVWDEDEKIWVNCSQTESIGQDIVAYLMIVGKTENVIFHHRQIMKVFGWDGVSFMQLAMTDFVNIPIQWRVDENLNPKTDVTNLQVAGIDLYDSEPGKLVQKLTPEEIQQLDAKYGNVLRKAVQSNQPIKPVGKPSLPWVKTNSGPSAPDGDLEPPQRITLPIPSGPSSPEPPQTAKLPKKTIKKTPTGCTEQEAWDACQKNKPETLSDDRLAETWCDVVVKIAPGGDESKMNPELWAQVRDIVIKQINDTPV
jgi:hypothetical protein